MKKFAEIIVTAAAVITALATSTAIAADHAAIGFETRRIENTGLQIAVGESSELISGIKDVLSGYELVEYSQLRPEVANLYDEKLEIAVQTLSEFCDYKNENHVIDDAVVYMANHLDDLSADMRKDIHTAYISNLRKAGKNGNLDRNGNVQSVYAWTQTDPDWATTPYPYQNDSSRSIASSACGPSSLAIIASNWTNNAILPTETAAYSVENGYRLSFGTSTELFASFGKTLGMPDVAEYQSRDSEKLFADILENGYMAIASMKPGHFTAQGHYIAIIGAKEIDGEQYFLVADPNCPNRIYTAYHDGVLIDNNPDDPFVWAKVDVFESECNLFFVFTGDFRRFDEAYTTMEDEVMLEELNFQEKLDWFGLTMDDVRNYCIFILKDGTLEHEEETISVSTSGEVQIESVIVEEKPVFTGIASANMSEAEDQLINAIKEFKALGKDQEMLTFDYHFGTALMTSED